ncbi:MAG: RsmE family RNA methyltransferase [Halioglobus sp.]|jgi:RsmE family RNA methyltransferase
MNTLLYSDADVTTPGQITICDHRVQHLTKILKVEVNQTLRVGELNGKLGVGKVVSISGEKIVMSVEVTLAPPAKLPLTLVLALPRPKMLRRILRTVAELGVPDLHLINSYRVEKSYWKTPALEDEKVQEYFVQGLEQARDTVLPRLHLHQRFKPFVEDELAALIGHRTALVAHPGDYTMCPRGISGELLLAIGPEGGFIPYEVEKLGEAGCDIVSLGSRILRVENAVTSLIGRLF